MRDETGRDAPNGLSGRREGPRSNALAAMRNG